MFFSSLLMLISVMSILFMFLNHPLSLGIILLIQTLLISLTTGLMNYNFWFSYILFLIMVGGMLILFIYMTSVASNEKFKLSPKLLILSAAMMFMTILILMSSNSFFMTTPMVNFDIMPQTNPVPMNKTSMTKYLNWPTNLGLYMIILYLLITLIMVVKVTKIQYGPLRQKY
uniref:NADH-ubiquinone oxidoreductase chain 6 n=1 Tax=Callipogon relictus TaxID=1105317 RepID=A0A343VZ32_9CUCU|nr:NADH dehydrogenase subunit 6 [Callipogon relictus]AVR43553.1 NADH dehydrogenase subunit 6 [Callipogon relictus]WDD39342.1 NADH dehydrogenase subunit 6 [Callipogon relictus]